MEPKAQEPQHDCRHEFVFLDRLQELLAISHPHQVFAVMTLQKNDWCVDNFGPAATRDVSHPDYRAYQPEFRWLVWGFTFYFRTEADAILFKMRWEG